MTCKRCEVCDRLIDDWGDFIDCVCSECVWEAEDEYEDDFYYGEDDAAWD